MPEVQLRKRVIIVEEVFHEGGPVPPIPPRRAAALPNRPNRIGVSLSLAMRAQ